MPVVRGADAPLRPGRAAAGIAARTARGRLSHVRHVTAIEVSPEPVRAGLPEAKTGVVGSPELRCVVHGAPRDPLKRETCSAPCRAALYRRRTRDELREALMGVQLAVPGLGHQVDALLERVDRRSAKGVSEARPRSLGLPEPKR